MKINIKTMHKLIMLSLVFAAFLPSCTKNKTGSSNVNSFISQDNIEVEGFTNRGYLKVYTGSGNYLYFQDVIPDTLGFAADTVNKFITRDGRVVDTIWFTKDYLESPDTTSEGYRVLYIPVEKYNRGRIASTFEFNFQAASVRSDEGTLDIAGTYKKGAATITITKVGTGTYVIDNAVAASQTQPNVIYVKPGNSLEMPNNRTGFGLGTAGASADVTTAYYNISYSPSATSPVGDTLRYTYKREARAPVKVTLLRQ